MSVLWTVLTIAGYIVAGLGAIVALILVALAIDTVFARQDDCRVDLYRVTHRRGGSITHRRIEHHHVGSIKNRRRAVLWLPGILARENQIDPIVSLFAGRDVYAARYDGLRFDGPNVAVPQVAVLLHLLSNAYDEVMVIGASHGGMLGAEAIDGLDAGIKSNIVFIAFDAPTSSDEFIPLPSFIRPFFTRFKPGLLSNILLVWVLPLLNKLGGLPKELNIIRPNPENLQRLGLPQDMTYKEYVSWVQQSAKGSLSGHRFSMWYSELRDMIESGRRGLPLSGLRDVPVMYIECRRNETIKQPDAADKWHRESGAPIFWVDMTHCGMTENLDPLVDLLKIVLSQV